jgi:hypothetical protein
VASRVSSRRTPLNRPPNDHLVLVFGESENDTRAIREMILALCPDVGRVEVRRRPLVLIKNARPEDIRSRADQVAAVVAAEDAVGSVVCVFAHEDCDAVEPGHVAVAERIEQALAAALRRVGIEGCGVHAVVPAWEIENWWLLWPEQVGGLIGGWRVPSDWRGRDVGKVANGKEALIRSLRPRQQRRSRRARVRDYRESDAPGVALAVGAAGLAADPQGRSASYARFMSSVASCCAAQ